MSAGTHVQPSLAAQLDDRPGAAAEAEAAPPRVRLAITVLAKPQPQGSKTRNRYGGVRDDNAERLHPWREAVKEAALEAMSCHQAGLALSEGVLRNWRRIDGPVAVTLTLTFDRSIGHYRTGKNAHLLRDGAPARPANRATFDIDKLQRSIFDALTDAGVWRDDSRVVDVRASKLYVGDPNALHIPGALITVQEVAP